MVQTRTHVIIRAQGQGQHAMSQDFLHDFRMNPFGERERRGSVAEGVHSYVRLFRLPKCVLR